MKRIFLLLILALFLVKINGQDKAQFDLNAPGIQKGSALKSVSSYSSRQLQNSKLEMTMISGGYFTIGTSNGLSSSRLDDNCAITFGHPYALTSYPVFSIDGAWYKLDDYFKSSSEIAPEINGDTLSISLIDSGKVSLTFFMISQGDGSSSKFVQKIVNLDSSPHTFGLGLVIDPALGKWGDGYLENQNGFLTQASAFDNASVPQALNVWEKSSGAKGMGIIISFDNKPDKIIAANWADVYKDQAPVFPSEMQKILYDLDLKFYWLDETISPLQEKVCSTTITLNQPDFSSTEFLRWDLPNFLTIENNLVFPQNMDSFVEVSSTGSNPDNNLNLNVETPSSLNAGASDYVVQLNPSGYGYTKISLQSHLIYEDKVVETTAKLFSGTNLIDEIHRNVFIPAAPVSDTCLVISGDSLDISSFPNVKLFFAASNKQTGQLLFNLTKDNIFLFENNNRIDNFDFDKAFLSGSKLTDVAFVLDCSGSMGDNINHVTQYLGEFADSLAARGYDYRIGVVTFSTTVDKVWDFTKDIEQVKANLNSISLWGGEEDSPSGLMKATELSFRPGSIKTIIWITDENYNELKYKKEQVVNKMLEMGITVNGVGLTSLETDWFNPIVIPTGGKFYDIYGNFRDIMLDISRMQASNIYELKYKSSAQSNLPVELKLELHYGGWGVVKSYNFNNTVTRTTNAGNRLSFYPNPFNPEITFHINKGNYEGGKIRIFNLLGQRVNEFRLDGGDMQSFKWNAHNDNGVQLGTGFYIVQLILTDKNRNNYIETAKILYLK